ncbi:Npun_F0296 family exosortase-dependent surface protein [Thermaurantiacus sp.]
MHRLLAPGAALLLAPAAHAVAFVKAPYGTLAPGEVLVVTFDAPAAPGFTVSGNAGIYSGAGGLIPGIARPLPGNKSLYMSVRRNPLEQAIVDTPLLRSLSFDLGSLDPTNRVQFFGPSGLVASFTGSQLAAPGIANGSGTDPNANARFLFNFGPTPVNRIVFTSGQNSFEFDNIAAGVVPEPSTWAMLLAGFGLIGLAMRRRRRDGQVKSVLA